MRAMCVAAIVVLACVAPSALGEYNGNCRLHCIKRTEF